MYPSRSRPIVPVIVVETLYCLLNAAEPGEEYVSALISNCLIVLKREHTTPGVRVCACSCHQEWALLDLFHRIHLDDRVHAFTVCTYSLWRWCGHCMDRVGADQKPRGSQCGKHLHAKPAVLRSIDWQMLPKWLHKHKKECAHEIEKESTLTSLRTPAPFMPNRRTPILSSVLSLIRCSCMSRSL